MEFIHIEANQKVSSKLSKINRANYTYYLDIIIAPSRVDATLEEKFSHVIILK